MSADLEARLRRLEDIEAIKQLKARYCAYADDGYDADAMAELFTEDAVWDGGTTFGRAEGRESIRRHFAGARRRISIARHQVMNPIIDVDGDAARGHWLLFQPCTDTRARPKLTMAPAIRLPAIAKASVGTASPAVLGATVGVLARH